MSDLSPTQVSVPCVRIHLPSCSYHLFIYLQMSAFASRGFDLRAYTHLQ